MFLINYNFPACELLRVAAPRYARFWRFIKTFTIMNRFLVAFILSLAFLACASQKSMFPFPSQYESKWIRVAVVSVLTNSLQEKRLWASVRNQSRSHIWVKATFWIDSTCESRMRELNTKDSYSFTSSVLTSDSNQTYRVDILAALDSTLNMPVDSTTTFVEWTNNSHINVRGF